MSVGCALLQADYRLLIFELVPVFEIEGWLQGGMTDLELSNGVQN
jgi:hypothetical protein